MKVLYLTKDLELIRKQLYEGLILCMKDLCIEDLLDDINTDTMTPAWVCFDYKPEDIAINAYAGLLDAQGNRIFKPRALLDGNYDVIVSGYRKGTGSSRETAAQCERFCGIRVVIAASFAPIHARNNINLGQWMGNHDLLLRLESGENLSVDNFCFDLDPISKQIIKSGGLFRFRVPADLEKPTKTDKLLKTLSEKILGAPAAHTVFREVNGGYSHEFTSAQVHEFLKQELGSDYQIKNPERFAVFEDHLIYAHGVTKMVPFADKIKKLSEIQREFQTHTGVRNYLAVEGISPGICHEVARQEWIKPGDFILATDSHTCMAGGNGALGWGVGTTEYAALLHAGKALVTVPESVRFNLIGHLKPTCTAKDIILQILDTLVKQEVTLNRVMEFGGAGLQSLSLDERATLCNMATECAARSGICETEDWRAELDAEYAGGVYVIDLNQVQPRVAKPGDPTYGALISELGEIPIQIAYAGSCTAGKLDDMAYYAQVVQHFLDQGRKVHPGVRFYIQFGSQQVKKNVVQRGWMDLFERAGVILLDPGCGACIGCGPGVSESVEQVTVSAINRNFSGRSGPGKLYLASPLTVATSAFLGKIAAYEPDLNKKQ